ncbi:MAG: 6-bladed beta-propeller, partial [Muribaculaceae bacterium]|nr:6-bladed beta-propeller [Muribaculaceae bacterium]
MKKRFITLRSLIAVAIAIVAVACGSKPPKQSSGAVVTLDENPVIARKKPIGKDTLTVVDLSKADSTIILKLSDLAEDIRFIRLQNSNSALVADGMTWVAGNRIIVYTDGVVRQFDMEGNYLGRIGDRGHGPG